MTRDTITPPREPARRPSAGTPGSSQGMPARQASEGRARPGQASSPQDASHEAGLAMPHERDQAVDMTEDTVDPLMDQAQKDLKRGLRDTGKTPAMNAAYQKLKRP
jgi:hypothetical protein